MFGLSWRPKPKVAAALLPILAERCQVHPVDEDVARRAGGLRGRPQAMGRTRTQADMLIAATPAQLGFVVVTRNEADLEGCGVEVLNPFRGG